ncbi:hypothetical protein LJK87_15125 [Paenibacillus sp. P25]|nr:hypothetical protein LJK87_15125 [Paenibacillus sp. P25]
MLPFILRGVRLVGIDSVRCSYGRRLKAWERLAGLLKADRLASLSETIGLDQALDYGEQSLKGEVRGRLVVHTGAD